MVIRWCRSLVERSRARTCTVIHSLVPAYVSETWTHFGYFPQHAPGVPKVLIGNRLHLEFKRQVNVRDAEQYAIKNHMAFFEVSSLCNFNIRESFSELSRRALYRNGMERLLRSNKGIFIVLLYITWTTVLLYRCTIFSQNCS